MRKIKEKSGKSSATEKIDRKNYDESEHPNGKHHLLNERFEFYLIKKRIAPEIEVEFDESRKFVRRDVNEEVV